MLQPNVLERNVQPSQANTWLHLHQFHASYDTSKMLLSIVNSANGFLNWRYQCLTNYSVILVCQFKISTSMINQTPWNYTRVSKY